MAAVSATVVVAKIATAIVTDKNARKIAGWILVIILAPIILLIIAICMLFVNFETQTSPDILDMIFDGAEIDNSFDEQTKNLILDLRIDLDNLDIICDSNENINRELAKASYYSVGYFLELEDEKLEEFAQCSENVDSNLDTVYGNIEETYTIIIEDYAKETCSKAYKYLISLNSQDINPGVFDVPDNKNNIDLTNFVIQAYEKEWGYVWGTFGQVFTQSLFEYKLQQYPDGVGNWAEFIANNWLNRRTADCIGLIKAYSWYDSETGNINYATNGMPDIDANYFYNIGAERGTIDTLPEIPGLAVWCDGHIGVYIGNGEIIEAMGTQYGVVKTKVSERNFTHWIKIPFINYIEQENGNEE